MLQDVVLHDPLVLAGVLLVLLVVVATLLQEEVAAAAAAEGSTTSEPSAGGEEVLLGSYSGGDTSLPLEGITLPENALSIGFESIGVFLLLAGLVGFVAYVVLGVDKTVAAVATGAYPYTGQT